MKYWDRKIVREQLDKKIIGLKNYLSTGGRNVQWIKTIRTALGISSSDLADRVGVNQSRIIHMEKAELEGNIKLATLKKVANALGMELVYGFVPPSSLEELMRQQATKIAEERMKRLSHTMQLELQGLPADEQASALKDMIDKILIDQPKDFWKK